MTGVIAAGCSPADEYADTEYAALPVRVEDPVAQHISTADNVRSRFSWHFSR